ncbi:hypothetical protein [Streptomyces sp. NPDC089799]|uniref:hypothetical protein n=1 Tax=Streptomyces sp. NPDC089799 TaxID=3155066 RepID=UPI0034145610
MPRSTTAVRTAAAAAGVLALGFGLLSAPSAYAAPDPATPKVTKPRTSPTPGFAGDGRYSACWTSPDTAPGWVGMGDVRATVAVGSPGGKPLKTTFQLWDTTPGGKRTNRTSAPATSGDVRVTYKPDQLAEGKRYAWRARATDSTLTSPYTPWCHFRVDRTPPTAAISSTDFPESGSGGTPTKTAGQEGTFTLRGTDLGSGIACARWGGPTPGEVPPVGWKCADSATDSHVVRLTNGSVKIRVKPGTWGTHSLYLQTRDNAGNVSQPIVYSFYVPPAQITPTYGDIDGDGKADVLLPDAGGHLRKQGADPKAKANAAASAAPGETGSWAKVQYTHRGSLGYKNIDDLISHAPGNKNLYAHLNDGAGYFSSGDAVLVGKPTACVDPAFKAISCAQFGHGSDWSKVTRIAAFGSPSRDAASGGALQQTSLLFVENGRLWLAPSGGIHQLDSAILLSGTNTRWGGYDLMTPGRAQGTDRPTLWARSQADGSVRAFTVKGTPEAPDFSAFLDPAKGTVLTTVPAAAYPRVGSDGDLTGDRIPDLWAVDSAGKFRTFPGTGTATPHPSVKGFGPAK